MAPWQLLAVIGAGWMSRQQQQVIEYLREENRVLRERLGKRGVLLNDDHGLSERSLDDTDRPESDGCCHRLPIGPSISDLRSRSFIYMREFRETLRAAGVTPVRLPPRSPDLNAYAERLVRSIKSESLDRLIIIGERHLRTAIGEYVEHYQAEQNHQGLEIALIAPGLEVGELSGPVFRRERLGGMLSYYHRKAA
ncbi:MAG: transposase [Planctomycetes bacterium]|nr:transposase [Planctomycetota bacterium]